MDQGGWRGDPTVGEEVAIVSDSGRGGSDRVGQKQQERKGERKEKKVRIEENLEIY